MNNHGAARRLAWGGAALVLAAAAIGVGAPRRNALREGFLNPPPEARTRCYWWWLNGNTDEATISRDLTEMKAKGYGGAILVDADGSGQQGNRETAAGPMFGTPRWRALYLHALGEAQRLGLEISLNIESGWNLGGPDVTPEEGAKLLTWSRVTVKGPAEVRLDLPRPNAAPTGFYRDIAVLAYPLRHGDSGHRPIRQLVAKSAAAELGMSMPPTAPLLDDVPATAGEEDADAAEVRDLSDSMRPDGSFTWSARTGTWEVLRIGYRASGAKVSTSSNQWQGLAIDYLDRGVFEAYWRRNVEPLLEIARPYLGKSLKYLVTDSWELGGVNWTPRFQEEFRARRGYDVLPYLPVVAGRIIGSRDASGRFLNDLRRTVGDLVLDGHYRPFAEMAARYGLGIHPESGGPHGAPIDALETLGAGAFPQTEYWAPSATHRVRDDERFFLKEAASAAHTYGKTLAAAEGMTSIGPQWEETPASLRPAFDRAVTEGMNRLFWHTFTSSPKSMGLPGQEYFAGTHLNPNVTWWREAGAFVQYLNRVQFLMQQGHPVADVLYYYGDEVPNFVQLKASDPAKVLPGYDYDAADEYVLTHRLAARPGELYLPEGVRYRMLVLPDRPIVSPAALRAIRKLVQDGAVVAGPRPERATGLEGDAEVRAVAAELWENCAAGHPFGKGVVYCGLPPREVLRRRRVPPDFEGAGLDYIHRQADGADIYFIRNPQAQPVSEDVTLRAAKGAAEQWNAVTGETAPLPVAGGRVHLHLEALGSTIVVLRDRPAATAARPPVEPRIVPVAGPWNVAFTPGWGAPASASFDRLISWTDRPEPGIRYYSGTATYSTKFDLPAGLSAVDLDLGGVREIATVRLNGRELGVLWQKPFRVHATAAARAGTNHLEIDITNLWPNRLIGDAALPPEERLTRTNITKFHAGTPLLPSGLLGPVRVEIRP
jgi:hypothetical protein